MSLGFELLFKLRSAAYECLAPGYLENEIQKAHDSVFGLGG